MTNRKLQTIFENHKRMERVIFIISSLS